MYGRVECGDAARYPWFCRMYVELSGPGTCRPVKQGGRGDIKSIVASPSVPIHREPRGRDFSSPPRPGPLQ